MNMMDYFGDKILERGFDYYRMKNVTRVVRYDGTKYYKANVSGNNQYVVEMDLDGVEEGKRIKMKCNCSYAINGAHCKHEAALLYYIKANDSKIQVIKPFKENTNIKEYIESIKVDLDSVLADKEDYEYEEEFARLFKEYAERMIEIYDANSSDAIDLAFFLYEELTRIQRIVNYDLDTSIYHLDDEDGGKDYGYLDDVELYDAFWVLEDTFAKIIKTDEDYMHVLDRYSTEMELDIVNRIAGIIMEKATTSERIKAFYNVITSKEGSEPLCIYENAYRTIIEYKHFNNKDFKYIKPIDIELVIDILLDMKEYEIILEIIKYFNLIGYQEFEKKALDRCKELGKEKNIEYFNQRIENFETILLICYKNLDKEKYVDYLRKKLDKEVTLREYKCLRKVLSLEECINYYDILEKSDNLDVVIELYKFENNIDEIWNKLSKENIFTVIKYEQFIDKKYYSKLLKKYEEDITKIIKINHSVDKDMLLALAKREGGKECVNSIIENVRKMDLSKFEKLKRDLEFIEMTI